MYVLRIYYRLIIHCSAGIGRTGTYIAVDSLTEEGETEGGVDVYAFVRNMRQQRVNMVQTVVSVVVVIVIFKVETFV
jgi:protein tyrosine phosphatase